jgi:hypothetical protein
MLKSTKNAVAVALIALCTACGQDNPTPSTTSTVVTPPPTPPTTPNKCDNIKNPLEEIEWLKSNITHFKNSRIPSRITQYTYKNKPIYHVEMTIDACRWFGNCDYSISGSSGICGIAGPTEQQILMYKEIMQNISNPIVLFEQK